MSAFYVGQRVRVVRADCGSRELFLPNGAEGVIVQRGVWVDWKVSFAGHRNPVCGGSVFPMFSDEIEPILPPGLESLTEINALYEPSPEVVA